MSPYKLISQLNYSSYRKENLDYWPFMEILKILNWFPSILIGQLPTMFILVLL